MNSSAKVRRFIARGAIFVFVAAMLLANGWLNSKLAPRPRGEISSGYLADPVELTLGDTPIRVTRFVLHPGDGLLTLEEDELTFNDYGDATRIGGKEPRFLWTDYTREFLSNQFLLSTSPSMPQRLMLAADKGEANNFRLIVPNSGRGGYHSPARILELRPPEIIPDEFGDRPQSDTFYFHTLGHRIETRKGETYTRLHGIGVSGSLATGGCLSIDPNGYGFHADGTVGSTTLLGWDPPKVTFKPLGPDPENRGRRAFELILKDPSRAGVEAARYQDILVLGPTEMSEHRLVFKTDGKATQVLRLSNSKRANHRYQLDKLEGVPAEERAAVRELATKHEFHVLDETDGHVTQLHGVRADLSQCDSIFEKLPHLTKLSFRDSVLPASGLPSLERIKGLNELSFAASELSDEGLASVGKVTGLRQLHIMDSKGLTGACLMHLAPLTNLTHLGIHRSLQPLEGSGFDNGLKHLTGMTRLFHLNLAGNNLTDAGLLHIGQKKSLCELMITGPQITDEGLRHLEGLTHLKRFEITAPRISPSVLSEFRARLKNN